MAKRLIDTNLFADEWFSELSKDEKLFFIYFITNCDHAGVLKLNKKLCEFQTGVKSERVIEGLGNRLVRVNDALFMPKFLAFQYPGFPNSKVRAQDSAMKILENFGLSLDQIKGYITLSKGLAKDYDNDNDNVVLAQNEKNAKKHDYNAFYDFEIEKSQNDENYIKFVKVLFGENPLGKPLDAVLKMRDQLSFEQFKYLWAIKEKTSCSITEVLLKMEDWSGLHKRNTILETFRTFATPKQK